MTIIQLEQKLKNVINESNGQPNAKECRELLNLAVDYIYEATGVSKPRNATLLELIDGPVVSSYINDADAINAMHYVRILGMNAQHGRSIRKKETTLACDNIAYIIGLISAKANGTTATYHKPPYMSEAATRRLYIDLYLREAGWDILEKDNVILPAKACIEVEVQGMPNHHGKGYCDYVLYGKNGKPLAIIEVKKHLSYATVKEVEALFATQGEHYNVLVVFFNRSVASEPQTINNGKHILRYVQYRLLKGSKKEKSEKSFNTERAKNPDWKKNREDLIKIAQKDVEEGNNACILISVFNITLFLLNTTGTSSFSCLL